ncbi:T-cell surface glycoprotein CD3 delta chain [Pipistrellus kuhlii]|uniref:T-cell surface glycoprotein CD3 delta chain n=1 Tax=Pipistrellus kuhlii TaxID=59472 RepID=A0A7J7RG82_PIPKU|nr:T-cell surface glycoprotein CD3 delta chain [Pipistrellus kuhlii]KAF6275073.1 CD3d molecule [Pipistrellus kuhlii]
MGRGRLLAGLALAALLSRVSPFLQFVEELEDKVFLNCTGNIKWQEGTRGSPLPDNQTLDLGKRVLDPRAVYQCSGAQENGAPHTLQVYYRMCQNCVELDPATLAGIIATDVLATLLLALGVYCFVGHETGRLSRAADTQALLRNDQLYQPLRDRNNAQYSHLGESWPRSR